VGGGFRRSSPKRISSDEGWVQINRVGLDIELGGEVYHVSSEMLAPPMSVAVYFDTSVAAHASRSNEIRAFLLEALTFAGFTVEFI